MSLLKLYSAYFMLVKDNESLIKLLIMHFAGTGSKAGTMLIKVNKSAHVERLWFVPHIIYSLKGFYFEGRLFMKVQ